MKTLFTCIFAVATAIYAFPVNAQNERHQAQLKPDARKTDFMEHPMRLSNHEIEMRAGLKPFPDSMIMYNFKGEPIHKAYCEYDERGNQTSYREYTKQESTNQWIETYKNISTYDATGNRLTSESSQWDENRQVWIGSNKYVWIYDSSGEEISSESYEWDKQSDTWKGYYKETVDYQTGNQRVTTYEWDSTTKTWVYDERTEYVSATVIIKDNWNTITNEWFSHRKIERKRILAHYKSGLNVTIDEECNVLKDNSGKWDEKNAYITYRCDYFAQGVSARPYRSYESYKITYDNDGNITSVTLTDYGDNPDTFTTFFMYDYAVNKVNWYKVYENNDLIDNYSCLYDDLGRIIEQSRSTNYDDTVHTYKYAYTYVGDSNTYNSFEHHYWDNSLNDFVKYTKTMYTLNEAGRTVMLQFYNWAETKWVLFSYIIYYPNEFTSDLEFEETAPVGSSNQGTFTVGFNLPQDADVTGTFYITFPDGFVLDEENTVLSDALSLKYSITITKQDNKNTWFVEIKELSTRSSSTFCTSEYKKILTVACKVNKETEKGEYKAEITDLNFLLSDGTILIEQQRDVTITVERSGTNIEQLMADKVKIFSTGGQLTIETPDNELINIYSANGEKVYSAQKTAGKCAISATGWKNGVYIVTGSQGWTAKVLIR